MNLTDIPTYVAELIAGHADAFAAALTGAVVGLGAGIWLGRRSCRDASRQQLDLLRAELDELHRSARKTRKLQIELALVRQQVKAVAKRAVKFRAYGKALQRRLRAEAERHREVAGELTAALDDARTRHADRDPRPDAVHAPSDRPDAVGDV